MVPSIYRFSLWLKILLLTASAMVSATAAPPPGSVDPSFDPGRGSMGVSAGRGKSALIQPDGKILVTGQFNGVGFDFVPAVVRFNPDGSLDRGFNAGALPAVTSYNPEDPARLLGLQANGQILLAGKFANPDGTARCLTRLNMDGSVDGTFNPQFETGTASSSSISQATALGGGRILVGGNFKKVNGVARPLIARLNTDGSLDQTFSPAVIPIPFVVQSTGKIVGLVWSNSAYRLVRLNSDGSVDASFASSAASTSYNVPGLLVQPDDKLIWTAIQSSAIPEFDTTTTRFNADGSDDPAFHQFSAIMQMPLFVQSDGKIIFSYGTRLNPDGTPDSAFRPQAMELFATQQPDGKLVAVGGFSDRPYGIRRLFPDGSRDDSFAAELGLTLVSTASIDHAAFLPSGEIVIAGNFNYIDRVPRNRIAVLRKDGTVDPAFDAGTLIGKQSDGTSSLKAIAVQADGKILLAMDRLVRVNPDGSVDSTFQYASSRFGSFTGVKVQPDGKILVSGPDGLVRLDSAGIADPTFHAAQSGGIAFLQPDGKIMVTGGTRGLTRLFSDGALDASFSGIGSPVGFNYPYAAVIQAEGKILVSRPDAGNFRDLFFRVNPDGTNDSSFVANIASVALIAVDQTGIYVGGNISPQADVTVRQTKLGVARLKFDGSRDENFSPAEFNSGATLTDLLLQADGQLLVCGKFDQVNGVERHGIARIIGNAPRKLANISTRANVRSGQMVEIAGFMIAGNTLKKIMVRAIGPSLQAFGVGSPLANPFLELHDATGRLLARNDNWRDTQETEILATGIPPAHVLESAIVQTLPPGMYTAVIQGADGGEGIALAEVYDLNPAVDSRLANISTRALVRKSDEVMISGFIVRGAEPSTVVLRGIGPSLTSASVTGPLSDPTVTLYDQSGTLVAANDDWKQTQQAELEARHIYPAEDRESAILATLPPGNYTAILRAAHDEVGVAVVEAYQLNP